MKMSKVKYQIVPTTCISPIYLKSCNKKQTIWNPKKKHISLDYVWTMRTGQIATRVRSSNKVQKGKKANPRFESGCGEGYSMLVRSPPIWSSAQVTRPDLELWSSTSTWSSMAFTKDPHSRMQHVCFPSTICVAYGLLVFVYIFYFYFFSRFLGSRVVGPSYPTSVCEVGPSTNRIGWRHSHWDPHFVTILVHLSLSTQMRISYYVAILWPHDVYAYLSSENTTIHIFYVLVIGIPPNPKNASTHPPTETHNHLGCTTRALTATANTLSTQLNVRRSKCHNFGDEHRPVLLCTRCIDQRSKRAYGTYARSRFKPRMCCTQPGSVLEHVLPVLP